METMEQSLAAEEERKEHAMYRTEDHKLNFLQRLEVQNKDKELELKDKFDRIRETRSRVKERQTVDKKRIDRKRFTVERKNERQRSQVKLA